MSVVVVFARVCVLGRSIRTGCGLGAERRSPYVPTCLTPRAACWQYVATVVLGVAYFGIDRRPNSMVSDVAHSAFFSCSEHILSP
jgi:hypothetical protein